MSDRSLVLDADGNVIAAVSGVPSLDLYPAGALVVPYDAALEAQGVWRGWRRQGGVFVKPSVQPIDLVDYAAAKRFEIETAGIDVGGVRIKTDRESYTLILGAKNLAEAEPDKPIRFKSGPGVFVTVDSPTILAIALAVGRNVRTLFEREDAATAAIAAGTATTTADIDRIMAGG